MKRVLAVLVVSLLLAPGISSARPKMMSVQIRKGTLRSSPSFLGTVVKAVSYGDRLTVLEKKAGWIKAGMPNNSVVGWIHGSALTKKRIKLKAGEKDADLAASSGELALAGKGFNSSVEAEFKVKNKDIDFTWVDRMEKIKVSHKEMAAFLKAGKLEGKEGGAE